MLRGTKPSMLRGTKSSSCYRCIALLVHWSSSCLLCRNPANADIFLSASGDNHLKIWDLRNPVSTMTIPAHQHEILTADWCKYNDCIIATGSVDKSIKVWDVRRPDREMLVLYGHG